MITETTTRRDALVKELRTYLAPVTKGDAPADTLRSLAGAALDDIAKGIRTREPALTPERAFVKAMDQAPELVKAYNDGQDRGEPAEFAPAPVAKQEAPPSAAWIKLEGLAKAKVEKGAAPTVAQAIATIADEDPALFAAAYE